MSNYTINKFLTILLVWGVIGLGLAGLLKLFS